MRGVKSAECAEQKREMRSKKRGMRRVKSAERAAWKGMECAEHKSAECAER